MDLAACIRSIPDYPKPGILFRDISTLLGNAEAWRTALDRLCEAIRPYEPERLAGIESRGFLLAAPLADRLGVGFTMIRKKGKLPGPVISHSYELEYGSDTVELQEDAVAPGERVVLVDDLLATGGTLAAAIALLRRVDANVAGVACLIELSFLAGRERLGGVPATCLIAYDD